MVHSEQIICKVAFWYFRRMALMFLLLTAGGAWFYYDGLINWPNKNKIYIAKIAFEAGSEKRQLDDFTRDIDKYDTELSVEDIELIKNVFQDGKLPMQWAEYEISTEGKRALSSIELNKLKEAFLLIEFISNRLESLQIHSDTQLPLIGKAQLQVDFLEERVIDLEELTDKLRGNGSHD